MVSLILGNPQYIPYSSFVALELGDPVALLNPEPEGRKTNPTPCTRSNEPSFLEPAPIEDIGGVI